jgi:hypothetical protein
MAILRTIGIAASTLTLGLAFAASSEAAMSKDEYKADKDRIAADYKSAKAGCGNQAGNARDICMADAKGRDKIAKAELEARYKPSEKHRYDVNVAKAEADYAVAKEKCDDKAGNDKNVCQKEAKAAETRAKADAKANMKTASADRNAAEKSSDARKDAAEDKRDADYAAAKAKCDKLASDSKDRCVTDAKARYGK